MVEQFARLADFRNADVHLGAQSAIGDNFELEHREWEGWLHAATVKMFLPILGRLLTVEYRIGQRCHQFGVLAKVNIAVLGEAVDDRTTFVL